jgi:hypothetical protein
LPSGIAFEDWSTWLQLFLLSAGRQIVRESAIYLQVEDYIKHSRLTRCYYQCESFGEVRVMPEVVMEFLHEKLPHRAESFAKSLISSRCMTLEAKRKKKFPCGDTVRRYKFIRCRLGHRDLRQNHELSNQNSSESTHGHKRFTIHAP